MSGIDSWSTTAATNALTDGGSTSWQEGMVPSLVNNSVRSDKADIRAAFNDLAWFNYGSGDQGAGNVAVPSVYASATSFTITGSDVHLIYNAGRRVRAVGTSTGTIYGTISSSSYNSGNSTTTVNVTWDSGSLSNETLDIRLAQIPVTGQPVPPTAVAGVTGTTGTGSLVQATNPTLNAATIITPGGGGSAGFILNASQNLSLANNGTQNLVTLGQGQVQTVFAFEYNGSGGVGNNVKADCIWDGFTVSIFNTVSNGSGIALQSGGSGIVQAKNTTGGTIQLNWYVK